MIQPAIQHCKNCNTKLENDDHFCAHCGQKQKLAEGSLKSLFTEYLDASFNLDARWWNTAQHLFIPAKLSIAYREGKRQMYNHPLRVFLICSLVMVTILRFTSNTGGYLQSEEMNEAYSRWNLKANLHILDSLAKDSAQIALVSSFKKHQFVDASTPDSLRRSLDSLSMDVNPIINIYGFNRDSIAIVDFLFTPDEELYKKEQLPWWEHYLSKSAVKLVRQGNRAKIAEVLINNLGYLLLFLAPLLAFNLLFFYRKRYYLEHLTFVLHIHAYIFLLLGTWSIVEKILPDWAVLDFCFGLLFFGFPFVATKRYYDQSWFKTSYKYLIGAFIYGIQIVLALVAFVLVGMIV